MNIAEAKLIIDELESKAVEVVDPVQFASAAHVYCEHSFLSRKGLSMRGIDGAPDWRGFETGIFRFSESLRMFLKARRDLRGANAFMDAVVALACDTRYAKGRQNLIAIVGEFGDISYAPGLAKQIQDPESPRVC